MIADKKTKLPGRILGVTIFIALLSYFAVSAYINLSNKYDAKPTVTVKFDVPTDSYEEIAKTLRKLAITNKYRYVKRTSGMLDSGYYITILGNDLNIYAVGTDPARFSISFNKSKRESRRPSNQEVMDFAHEISDTLQAIDGITEIDFLVFKQDGNNLDNSIKP
jgi:hypothetical protein